MFDGFIPQPHTTSIQQKIAGFSPSVTRESKLLQTIRNHVVDQLHLRCVLLVVHSCIKETLLNFLYIFNV